MGTKVIEFKRIIKASCLMLVCFWEDGSKVSLIRFLTVLYHSTLLGILCPASFSNSSRYKDFKGIVQIISCGVV